MTDKRMPKSVAAIMASVQDEIAGQQVDLADQIEATQAEIDSLKERLLMVTDEQSFDSISNEIVVLEKKAALLEAKQRITSWQEREKLRVQRLTDYNARVGRIKEIASRQEELDRVIFEALLTVVKNYDEACKVHAEAGILRRECQNESEELGEAVPEISRGPVFDVVFAELGKAGQRLGTLADAFFNAWAVWSKAKAAGIPVEPFGLQHVLGPDSMRFNPDGSIMKY